MTFQTDNMGGLLPQDVLVEIKKGSTLHPTDKNYKIYLDTSEGHFKAYFDNWTTEQKQELIKLHNSKKINFAAPGYFYVWPFFMKQVD
jgi:hypothetical protein